MSKMPEGRGTVSTPLRLVALALLVIVVGGGIWAIAAATGGNVASPPVASATPPAGTTATPGATASPAATATSSYTNADLAPTPCATAKFGPPLPPLNPPANIHVYPAEPPMEINTALLYEVTIVTPVGSMVECLQPSLAPHTVNNFVVLTRNHFYDGLQFFRVAPGFVIQGGDPTNLGTGGPGYQFNDEPVQGNYTLGTMAMANSGPNTNGSQFFICIANDSTSLAAKYNLFGHMVSGIAVAEKVTAKMPMTAVTVSQEVS